MRRIVRPPVLRCAFPHGAVFGTSAAYDKLSHGRSRPTNEMGKWCSTARWLESEGTCCELVINLGTAKTIHPDRLMPCRITPPKRRRSGVSEHSTAPSRSIIVAVTVRVVSSNTSDPPYGEPFG